MVQKIKPKCRLPIKIAIICATMENAGIGGAI